MFMAGFGFKYQTLKLIKVRQVVFILFFAEVSLLEKAKMLFKGNVENETLPEKGWFRTHGSLTLDKVLPTCKYYQSRAERC